MIAVQTNEYLYVIEMGIPEFLENVAKDGLNSSAIRAKTVANINQNRWLHLANAVIPEIECCFRQVGEQFVIDTKAINSSKDLEFYMAPDGSQYSCESAYVLETAKKSQTQELNQDIPNPTLNNTGIPKSADASPEIPNPIEEASTASVGASEPESIQGPSTVIALPASLEDDFYKRNEPVAPSQSLVPAGAPQLEEDLQEDLIEVSEEQKRAAGQLDNIVRNLPHVSSLPPQFIRGIRNYILAEREKFTSYAEDYLQRTSPLDRFGLLTDFPVPTALGESYDMASSLLSFPVYTRIVSKKDLAARFSPMDLTNSFMVRVCPLGLEDGKIQSYVSSIKITSRDVKEAEEIVNSELKKQGKSKRGLSSAEKYERFEAALEQVYRNKKGSFLASRDKQLTEDLDKYLDELVATSKVYIPSISEWNQYDYVALDAREKEDQFPTPLLTQLQNLNGKSREELGAVMGGPLEDPFEDNFEDFNESTLRTVKLHMVDTTLEGDQVADLGFIEVAENFLSETEKQSIVAEADGSYRLDGYFFDMGTDAIITDIEYQEIMNKRQQDSSETLVLLSGEAISATGVINNRPNYISLDGLPFELQSKVAKKDGALSLEGYYYDETTTQVLTEKEIMDMYHKNNPFPKEEDSKEEEEQTSDIPDPLAGQAQQQEEKSSDIPNPVAGQAQQQDAEVAELLRNRKYRKAILVQIPTGFSTGKTPEKIAELPGYNEFVQLSEDDMTDEIKACIIRYKDGFALDGYCYDYDQRRLMTTEEFFRIRDSIAQKAEPAPQDTTPIGALGADLVGSITMGGVPITSGEPLFGEKGSTPDESLVDYVKPDGRYVDPDGIEWASKDEWTLYKMLSDDQFLSDEEAKEKNR